MKIFRTILALITLFALATPCIHAEADHHEAAQHVELCPVDHADCHCQSSDPCSKPDLVVENVLVVELSIPIRKLELISVLETSTEVSLPTFRPPGDLLHLQTVQLRI